MDKKIIRCHYRGQLKKNLPADAVEQAIKENSALVRTYMEKGQILTAGVFRYHDMLFAYYECIEELISADELFAPFHHLVEQWPEQDGLSDWAKMYLVFYFAIPEGLEDWRRKTEPDERCGRIAFLRPENMFEYVAHHFEIAQEGYLIGEKYQSIALHENILFSYYEDPRLKEINVRRDLSKESLEIKKWLDTDPGSHFYRFPDEGHFNKIDRLFAL